MQLAQRLFLSLITHFWPIDPVPPYPIESWKELPFEEWPAGYDPISDSFPKKGLNQHYKQQEETYTLILPRVLPQALA